MDVLGPLFLAFLAYIIGTASPGPATLTIMMTAAGKGRAAALRLAVGVICGSIVWGVVATIGLSVAMSEIATFLYALKFVGGAYLLWLAWQSISAAMHADAPTGTAVRGSYFLKGFLLHLTNPKAVLVWGSILTIGITPQSPTWVPPVILLVCSFLGAGVFVLYAVLFSTKKAMAGYIKARRPIQAACGALFGAAGLKLVMSRS
ncbi:MAG: LysE family transporter [Alphaproteobacteria bacterium]|nr:LysE family transporter [Alphaproteobacteria bacterium]